jgi:hypothetical protein
MKLFFERDNSEWARESGYAKRWESFIAELGEDSGTDSITDNKNTADVIIHYPTESLNINTLLRPLSNDDVRRFVLNSGDHPTGRMSGFYSSLHKTLFRSDRHRTVHYPIPFNELVEEFPQSDVVYNFGFLGGMTAALRQRLYDRLKPTEAQYRSCIKIQGLVFSTAFDGTGMDVKREYIAFLRRTRFILCPRGLGVGSVRIFEAMKAGRVPVIISDKYVLPSGIDWDSCAVRIREKDINNIPTILESRLPDWPQMAINARSIWQNNFSNKHFLRYLITNIEGIISSCPTVNLSHQIEYAVGIGSRLAEMRLRPTAGRIKNYIKPSFAL